MTNKVYSLSDKEFIELIKSSLNISEVLFKLGYSTIGNSWGYSQIKKRMTDLNLTGLDFRGKNSTSKPVSKPLDYNKLFSSNSSHSRAVLRREIIKNNLIPYKCAICGISIWNNKTLSLELDHINGINNDNRLENLRFLCPNCHSQTSTYGSRNKQLNESHYEISKELSDIIIKEYSSLHNIIKVSRKLGISRKAVKQALNEAGLSKSNQKYVIQYDSNHNELNRFGSITDCCKYLIDNNLVNTKTIKTCRNILKRINNTLYKDYYFEILDA